METRAWTRSQSQETTTLPAPCQQGQCGAGELSPWKKCGWEEKGEVAEKPTSLKGVEAMALGRGNRARAPGASLRVPTPLSHSLCSSSCHSQALLQPGAPLLASQTVSVWILLHRDGFPSSPQGPLEAVNFPIFTARKPEFHAEMVPGTQALQ